MVFIFVLSALTAVAEADVTTDTIASDGQPINPRLHTVARGETWSMVAARYEITEEALRLINPLVSTLHTGMSLNLPSNAGNPLSASQLKSYFVAATLQIEAVEAIDAGNYGKAVELCGKALAQRPSSQIYATRGLAQAARGKWRQASEDYERAMSWADDEETRKSLEPLYEDACRRHRQWWKGRTAFWNLLGKSVAEAGINTLNAYAFASNSGYYPISGTSFNGAAYGSSLGGYAIPPSLDFRNYFTDQPLFEFHWDENGNCYSTANGLADMMAQMNADFNRDIYGMVSGLALAGNYTQASSLMAQLQSNNMTSKFTENRMRMPVYGVPDNVDTEIDNSSSYSYQDSYDRYARLAEMWGHSIEVNGYGADDSNGRHNSAMDVTSSTTATASIVMRQGVRNAQKEMRRIREEARRQGVSITASKWEDASTSVY